MTRTWIALAILCSAVCPLSARDGSRAEYIGATCAEIPNNNNGEIRFTDNTYFIFISKHTEVKVPYERVNLLEYGLKVDRRFVAAAIISPALALMKKEQHFLTIGYEDNDGHQQALMFRLNKDDVRLTLVALEARTGQKVEFQDEQARIAGKG